MMKPSASLNRWREYFQRGDSDIFGIIDHAIMVAAIDCPNKFKSRKDKIVELLFSSRVSRCTGCNHLELSVPGDDVSNHGRGTGDDVDTAVDGDEDYEVGGGSKEIKVNSSRGDNNHIVSNYIYDEAEALSDTIEEFSIISKEVGRIKGILLNREDEVAQQRRRRF